MLGRVSAGVSPKDIIENIWVRDVVDHTWEILRLRRIKKGLVSSRVQTALSKHLEAYVYGHPEYPQTEESGTITQKDIETLCESLAERWVMKDPDVVAWVDELGGYGSFSIDEVMATAFTKELDRIERVDHLVAVAESRRNSVLREMDRRRAFAQSLRGEIQKVEDAEFEVIEPQAILQTNNANKNAA